MSEEKNLEMDSVPEEDKPKLPVNFVLPLTPAAEEALGLTPMPEFREFPKIARLSRDIIITEKIDGTNGLICITEDKRMFVGSRTRWITPTSDNFGFAKWAEENRLDLLTLGPGYHYGEWWGNGIQRGYNQAVKRFSLFNVYRWTAERPKSCGVVPILYQGSFETEQITHAIQKLKTQGSTVAPGFADPEGIVIFHTHSRMYFKKTIVGDAEPKALSPAQRSVNRLDDIVQG